VHGIKSRDRFRIEHDALSYLNMSGYTHGIDSCVTICHVYLTERTIIDN